MLKDNHKKSVTFYLDPWLLGSSLILILIGLLMVFSASMVVADRQYHFALYFLVKQSIYLGMGIIAAGVMLKIPLSFIEKYSNILMLFALLLLALVLMPGLGHSVNGARRWLGFSFLSLQVSEIAKLGVVLFMAGYITRHPHEIRTYLSGFIKPFILLIIMAGLLLLEPDFGATSVITCIVLGLLFLSGVRLWPLFLLLIFVAMVMGLVAILSPYRLARLTTFLNPWTTPFGSGYQLTQSLIAFGRGGLTGVGLGNSVQKLFYLPEAHTDFLFAVLAEELGLIGALLVIVLFVAIVVRCFVLARRAYIAEQFFTAFVAYGLGLWLGIQAFVNIGVTAGMLPTKVLTLPFISYGGSSLIVNCVVVGLLLRLSMEVHSQNKATRVVREQYTARGQTFKF